MDPLKTKKYQKLEICTSGLIKYENWKRWSNSIEGLLKVSCLIHGPSPKDPENVLYICTINTKYF